jgi:hypothetical protein
MQGVTRASKSHHLPERIASYPTAPISTEEIPDVQGDLPVESKLMERYNIIDKN